MPLSAVIIWFASAAISLPVVVSDFRRRRVAVTWLAAVFAAASVSAVYAGTWQSALSHLISGCILILLLMLCLRIYLMLRHGGMRLCHAFGAGDWCYIAAVSPLFPPSDLLKLLVASSLLSLVWHSVLNRRRTIPFAGMTGTTLILITIIRFCALWL